VCLEKSLPVRMQADLGATFEILNLGWLGDTRAGDRTARQAVGAGAARAVVVYRERYDVLELQREQSTSTISSSPRRSFARHCRGGSIGGRVPDGAGATIDMRGSPRRRSGG
jgi:hypothetical protein